MTDHFGEYGTTSSGGGISADEAVAISTYVTDQALAPLEEKTQFIELRQSPFTNTTYVNGPVAVAGVLRMYNEIRTDAHISTTLGIITAGSITLNGTTGVVQGTTIQSTGVLQSFANFRVRDGAIGPDRLFVNASTGDVSVPGALTPGSITTHSPTGLYDLFSSNIVIVRSDAQLLALNGGTYTTPSPGQPDTGFLYTLLPNTTYIFKDSITLTAGLKMAQGTTVRGFSAAVGVSFTNAVSPCFYSTNVDFFILDIQINGGAKLFNCVNLDLAALPPVYGRNNLITVKNSTFQRVRTLGEITGHIFECRGSFFYGGGFVNPLSLTTNGGITPVVAGTTYSLTSFGVGNVGTGLTIKALTIDGSNRVVTWRVINEGVNYRVGETVQHTPTGMSFIVTRVYFTTSGVNNTTLGVVGDSTVQGLNLISPRFVGMSDTRFSAFRGFTGVSSTYQLQFASPLGPEPIFGLIINGNSFFPADTETGMIIQNGVNLTQCTCTSNAWLTPETGATTTNIYYTPFGLYNSLSMKGFSFLNNTNVTNSSAYLTVTANSNTGGTGANGATFPIGVLPAGLDASRLQRFSTLIPLVWASSPTNVIAGYSINLLSDTGTNAYIIRVGPLTGLTQNIYVVNMTPGFIVSGVSYQIRNEAGALIPGTLPTIQLSTNTLTPFQTNLERVAGGLYSVTANLQFSMNDVAQTVAFNILQNSNLSGISATTSVDQKNSTRTATVSGILSLATTDSISLSFTLPGVSSVGVVVSKLTMNIFPVG